MKPEVRVMFSREKREAQRFKFRFFIQYERVLEDGGFGLPFTVPARDISISGISFYANESMSVHSKARISFELEKEKISFITSVVRMEIVEDASPGFLIGAKIEAIEEKIRLKITDYINRINIYNALKDIELRDVVDIHFVSGYPPIVKKMRDLSILKGEVLNENILRGLLLNILDDERYKKFIREKEINFVFFYKEGVRFRVNLHIQQGKVEGVFRLIPSEIQLPHQLGLPPAVEKIVLDNTKGLILVAGRTGSGKTTTLASMVELLNTKRKGLVLCIENPIEYIHANKKCIIKQREVGRDTLSFSNAAKNALRQNPDVLIIGEILDTETMEVAITAAETGMLVLTSIHAADSSQALDRVASFFPAKLQIDMLTRLSLVLRGVITQSLIPRKDGKHLVMAAEVLVANNALRRIIRDRDWKQTLTIIQMGRNIGMQSMRNSLEEYFSKGIIDKEYLQEYSG